MDKFFFDQLQDQQKEKQDRPRSKSPLNMSDLQDENYQSLRNQNQHSDKKQRFANMKSPLVNRNTQANTQMKLNFFEKQHDPANQSVNIGKMTSFRSDLKSMIDFHRDDQNNILTENRKRSVSPSGQKLIEEYRKHYKLDNQKDADT